MIRYYSLHLYYITPLLYYTSTILHLYHITPLLYYTYKPILISHAFIGLNLFTLGRIY
ncbi:hypothetical protein L873DRAFT_1801608 [Choiromyces venosus 120613-1]|uniref:Uncharacterized protein n=1 Tax=Choiromyces venosus 120613-1 TaxID=1336337 RepID=A0A3N4JXA0_9PEZI|nr:hypothetical protein L873DRAFT_1801608 [Choiromyces venosus 120613-1]